MEAITHIFGTVTTYLNNNLYKVDGNIYNYYDENALMPKGSYVIYNNTLYKILKNATGVEPGTDTTYFEEQTPVDNLNKCVTRDELNKTLDSSDSSDSDSDESGGGSSASPGVDLTNYLTVNSAASTYATIDSLTGYAKTSDLNGYVTESDLAGFTKPSDLENFATLSDLESYAKITDLESYAKISDLEGYAKSSDLEGYITEADLADYAKTSDLDSYLLKADFNSTLASASIDASQIVGTISVDNIPATALSRMVIVDNKAARLALTIDEVQTGDVVKQNDTDALYFVYNDGALGTEDAFQQFTASVDWSSITSVPAEFTPSKHTHVASDITDLDLSDYIKTSDLTSYVTTDALANYVQLNILTSNYYTGDYVLNNFVSKTELSTYKTEVATLQETVSKLQETVKSLQEQNS